MRLQEVVEWSLEASADDPAVIVLKVDDAADTGLAAALVSSRGFAGSWRAGTKDDTPIVSFLLLEDGGPGLERAWWTEQLDATLLEAATRVPHHVRLVSTSTGAGLQVEVDHASARVTELLAAYRV